MENEGLPPTRSSVGRGLPPAGFAGMTAASMVAPRSTRAGVRTAREIAAHTESVEFRFHEERRLGCTSKPV